MMPAVKTPVLDEWADINAELAQSTPHEIIEWAVERYYPRLTMATAFGAEGCILLHLLAEIEPKAGNIGVARSAGRAIRD
jgi:phosphoadenosine phosphosulfate reductase